MFKDRKRLAIIGGLGVLFICIICGVIYVAFPSSDKGEPTSVAEVQTEVVTEGVAPEETSQPTEPPPPTDTPEPTNTPEPSNTPLPTATPTEVPTPTPLPEPVVLTGSGDSVVDFENPFEVSIAHVTANAASRHFSIWSYDANGNQVDLLVNTTDPYEGIVLMDTEIDSFTTRFEVTATGVWIIVVDHLTAARELEVPGTIEGVGDDVVILRGGTPDLANVTGNEASRHFSIWGYGSSADLLVNTTDPYEGTVILSGDTIVLEITAVGPWSIEVTTK